MEKSNNELEKAGIETVAAMIASGAGVAVGGPAGAVFGAAAAPAVATGASMLINQIRNRRLARSGEVLTNVAQEQSCQEWEVADRIVENDRLLELASRVILAAQDMADGHKRKALARALSAAVIDTNPAVFDISELLTFAISNVDAVHIRFLHVLSKAGRIPERMTSGASYGMSISQVCNDDPGLKQGGQAVLQRLLSLGLMEDVTNGLVWGPSANKYAVSSLGWRLLDSLESAEFDTD